MKKIIGKVSKKVLTFASVLVSLMATQPVSYTSAASVNVSDGIYVIQSALDCNKVIDICGRGTSNGTNCQLHERNNSAAQALRITYAGEGYYTIQMAATDNMVFDVIGGTGYAGCNVAIWSSNGSPASDNQLWRFEDAGSGYYYIVSRTGYYLDVSNASTSNGANIQVYSGNQTNAQKFRLTPNYDVKKATDYAYKYTNSCGKVDPSDNEITYNTTYNVYKPTNPRKYIGFDCANFGSQCIYEGGFVATNQWAPVYRAEDYRGNTAKTTWVSAKDFYYYLSSSLGYPTYKVESSLKNIHLGDIVFTGKGDHTTICSSDSKNGTPKYCAHSSWRQNL